MVGVDVSELALETFFQEQSVEFTTETKQDFKLYKVPDLICDIKFYAVVFTSSLPFSNYSFLQIYAIPQYLTSEIEGDKLAPVCPVRQTPPTAVFGDNHRQLHLLICMFLLMFVLMFVTFRVKITEFDFMLAISSNSTGGLIIN